MIRKAVGVLAYPVCLLGSVVLAHEALSGGAGAGTVTAAAAIVVNLIVFFLERVMPFEQAWSRARGDVFVDAAHVPLTAIAAELGRAAAASLVIAALPAQGFSAFSPWALPWPVALVIAVLVAELPVYWIHRFQHGGGLLWRIHEGHHAVGRLYFLNANRNHPVDVFIGALTSLGLLGLLGAPATLLALVAVATTVHVTFQHSNTDVRFGPLNAVLSSPEVHRFHHEQVLAVSNANYGGFTLVWDLVFGTRRVLPRRPSADVGLVGGKAFPTTLLGVLAAPFRARRPS